MTKEQKAAREFAEKWKGHGAEKQESQLFWLELLEKVLGAQHPTDFVRFEEKVKLSNTSFIDIMVPATHTMIEQKSIGKELGEPIKQSDGTWLTPFQQAKRYAIELPYSDRPRWIVICNFRQFDIYDMQRPNDPPTRVELANLEKDWTCLRFITDVASTRVQKEMELSRAAGELVGKIYDALLPCYGAHPTDADYQDLNKLIVRLVFCFYAEDAGLFGRHDQFHDYMASYAPMHFSEGLGRLFSVLDKKQEERPRFLEPNLRAFPYVNGSLFTEELAIPPMDETVRRLILEEGCGFDWSKISPTIFGAIFESTLNPATRRQGGMHYTSIENIHKVIDPLFLDAYRAQYQAAMQNQELAVRRRKLRHLQQELGRGRYFDRITMTMMRSTARESTDFAGFSKKAEVRRELSA
ncbi:type IIL restriction-modification enzyme MmeI [uncultured Selenomonas sp.]|uniref:type IIL restriction-modification enzyme MmeI n=1 Tax=uncultured Selenomonas sp. TaxID=159275 RepID=UPI0025D1E940|nr:type IIL restriction-modification enzyme MmeI [uncultured Selenomonas sp.]